MLCHPEPHPMVNYALQNRKSRFALELCPSRLVRDPLGWAPLGRGER